MTIIVLKKHKYDNSLVISSRLENTSEVIKRISKDAGESGFSSDRLSELQLALQEGIANAVKHGNKFDDNKKVKIDWKHEKDGIRICIKDEGKGFDPSKAHSPLAPENIIKDSGRGIHFIKQLCSNVLFNKKGNQITFIVKK